ncbi:MAG: hypothetical protein JO262_11560 [Solirubrobacterales bacterium]|nr:hypothetical protein [Solirubrobacterales bacterium]MBV9942756.1 hypothetical protein [Solirubrobacterales bacterium]
MEQSGRDRPGSSAATSRRRSEFRDRGPRSWSPLQPGSTYEPGEDRYWLDREMTLIERALEDKGEMRRSELGELIGCKYWGPGRFARALKAASEQGRIKHSGFGRYAPSGGGGGRD